MDIPLKDILEQYLYFRLAASLIKPCERSDLILSSSKFPWEDSATKIDDVFLYMHKKWHEHLANNIIEPAIEVFTSKVLEEMHLSCIRELLYTNTLLSVEGSRRDDPICCICGEEVSNPEYVAFLPNPYLMWKNNTNCSQPYATYFSNLKHKVDHPPRQTFAMHFGNASLLFAVWRLIHFDYFVDVNLHSTEGNSRKDLQKVLLASIESCIGQRPPCRRPCI